MTAATGRFAGRLRLRLRPRDSRGAVEIGVALVLAALFVGMLFGNGVARTAVSTSDGLTWLGDGRQGDVVQVNPQTGRPENKLHVGQPGNGLQISQTDGLLVVTDPTTGLVTVIDVATLLAAGRRNGSPNGATEVLLDANQLYIVDRGRGAIQRIDPLTTADIGQEWSAGGQLADAALDGQGAVWALRDDGRLFALSWSEPLLRLVEQPESRPVNGSGPKGVLVPHERGVTVLGPEGGVVVQTGTGRDLAAQAPRLRDPVHGAQESPADLVPASIESESTVVILNRDTVLEVNVGAIGCSRPGRPVVFHELIYVPCPGDRKVIVLDRNGHRARPDIVTPDGGEPELVLDDGRLIVNVPGAATGIVVEPNGSTRTIGTHDRSLPAQDPRTRPPAPLPPPAADRNPRRPEQPPNPPNPPNPPSPAPPGGTPSPGPTNTVGVPSPSASAPGPPGPTPNPSGSTNGSPTAPPPSTTPPPTPPPTPTSPASPPPGPVIPPSGVTAEARGDGSVLVSWTPGTVPDSYRVLRTDNGGEVASTPGSATSAVVTTLGAGETVAFAVEAVVGGRSARSAPSNPVTAYRAADAPGDVRVFHIDNSDTQITVRVRWDAPNDNGGQISGYRVEVQADGGDAWSGQEPDLRAGPITLRCGNPRCDGTRVQARVHATNPAGDGPPGTGSYTHDAGPPPVRPPQDGDHVITGGSAEGLRITITLNDLWAQHPHGCAVDASGPIGAAATANCDANRASVTVFHHDTEYTVKFLALDRDAGRWIESAPITVRTDPRKPPPDPDPDPTPSPDPSCDPDPCERGSPATIRDATLAGLSGVATVPVALLTGVWAARRRRPAEEVR